mgnify:FL=1
MTVKGNLTLKAEIDEGSGFCFGVVRAITKAEEMLEEGGQVYCVGQIVHNEEEVSRLSSKGLITIRHNELKNLSHKNILFRAHGEPPDSYHSARTHKNRVVDATCPIVLKLQRDIHKSWQRGENVFIFGKSDHPEVKGLNGQTSNQAVIFQSLEELKDVNLPHELTLFSQTTMNLDAFYKIVEYLKDQGIDVQVRDTICRQVSNRKHELETFSRSHDRVLFVAGKNSSNGKALYHICRRQNPNTHFVSTTGEIQREWFRKGETIGICGATSTPHWLLEKVKTAVEAL